MVNGTPVATLGGPSACTRAATAAAALNSAFAAGDDFEFCTPSWWSDTAPYALVTVKSAKRGNSSTWYKSDKRLIVAATPDDSARPWWSVLVWGALDSRPRRPIDEQPVPARGRWHCQRRFRLHEPERKQLRLR